MESKSKPKTLSEAIEQLEGAGRGAADDFKNILEKDYAEIKRALETLRPYLSDLQDSVEHEVKKKKEEAEKKVKENPWIVIALVGIFAFIFGLFMSHREKQ